MDEVSRDEVQEGKQQRCDSRRRGGWRGFGRLVARGWQGMARWWTGQAGQGKEG